MMNHSSELVNQLAKFIVRMGRAADSEFAEDEEALTGTDKDSERIINSCLFRVVFNFKAGYHLTKQMVRDAGARKRPSIGEAKEKLTAFRKKLSADQNFKDLADSYDESVIRFLGNRELKSFFSMKLNARMLYGGSPRSILYVRDR